MLLCLLLSAGAAGAKGCWDAGCEPVPALGLAGRWCGAQPPFLWAACDRYHLPSRGFPLRGPWVKPKAGWSQQIRLIPHPGAPATRANFATQFLGVCWSTELCFLSCRDASPSENCSWWVHEDAGLGGRRSVHPYHCHCRGSGDRWKTHQGDNDELWVPPHHRPGEAATSPAPRGRGLKPCSL